MADSLNKAYNPTYPTIYSNPNTKLLNVLDTLLNKGECNVPVGGNTSIRCNLYYLSVADDTDLPLRARGGVDAHFTEFDRAVLGAISSLSLSGNRVMTAATIHRVLTGSAPSSPVNDTQIAQIEESIHKLGNIFTSFDCTDEFVRNGIPLDKFPDGRAYMEGTLLRPQSCTVQAGGHSVTAYDIPMPLLYTYANTLNQVIPISMKYLAVGGDDTHSRIAIKLYLLRRILASTNKMSKDVLYETIYERSGIPDTLIAKKRMRDFVHKCLTAWVELELLDGFTINPSPSDARQRYYSITLLRAQKLYPEDISNAIPAPSTELAACAMAAAQDLSSSEK